MATHSSILAWRILSTEEPGGLLSIGSRRVGHDWSILACMHALEKETENPLQYSCLENPRDGGAWWAAIYGVAQSQTRLMRLSSSSIHSPSCRHEIVYILILKKKKKSCNKLLVHIFLDTCLRVSLRQVPSRVVWKYSRWLRTTQWLSRLVFTIISLEEFFSLMPTQ